MRKAPAFQLYARDAIADTLHLSTEEFGAYFRLLFQAWIGVANVPQGHLPTDDLKLRKMTGMSASAWAKSRGNVLDLYTLADDGSTYYHPRLLEELERQQRVSERRAESGKAGAIAKQLLSKRQANGSAKSSSSSASALASDEARQKKGAAAALRAEFGEDFDLWKSTLPAGTKAVPTDGRWLKYKARREDSSRDEIREALQGWKMDPWPDRAQHNDFEVLIRNRAQVEKFSRLYREAQPAPERKRRDGDEHFNTDDLWSEALGRWVPRAEWRPVQGVLS